MDMVSKASYKQGIRIPVLEEKFPSFPLTETPYSLE